MTVPPHLAVPFTIGGDGAVLTVEQDSAAEVAQCVAALVVTPVGSRPELPSYGSPGLPLARDVDTGGVIAAVERWEPRAAAYLRDHPSPDDELVRIVTMALDLTWGV